MESATKHSLKYVSKFDLPGHSPGLFIFICTNKSQMLRMFSEANIFISTKASFFGDPDFPRSAMQYFKGAGFGFTKSSTNNTRGLHLQGLKTAPLQLVDWKRG
jgi:hypothetical protein